MAITPVHFNRLVDWMRVNSSPQQTWEISQVAHQTGISEQTVRRLFKRYDCFMMVPGSYPYEYYLVETRTINEPVATAVAEPKETPYSPQEYSDMKTAGVHKLWAHLATLPPVEEQTDVVSLTKQLKGVLIAADLIKERIADLTG